MRTTWTLSNALEQAYQAFACMPRPRHFDTSSYRNGEEILRTLTSAPLRELQGEQIGPYAGWALTTVGSERDYRHFLPRILELAISDPTWVGTEPAVIASKLRRSNWAAWPVEQQDAVRDVFGAAFFRAMESPSEETSDTSDWLCGLASLGIPIEQYLAAWRQSASLNAVRQLLWFVIMKADEVAADGSISGSFWDDVDASSRRVIGTWLTSPATYEQLAKALDRAAPNDREVIERVLSEAGHRS
jgi:hypothetical protein